MTFCRNGSYKIKKGIGVLQCKYVLNLFTKIGMISCKPNNIPIEVGDKYKNLCKMVDREKYQRFVGKRIYLFHIRLDITFAVSEVSQHMYFLKEAHLEAVYRVFRYLKGSPDKRLFFERNEARNLEVYIDADWANLVEDRGSIIGYCTFVFGNLVTWRSEKNVVVRSNAEVKFRAIAQGSCEALWLRKLLTELQIPTSPINM